MRDKQDEKGASIRMRKCRRMRGGREGVARLKSRIWRPARPRKGSCFLAVAAGRIGSGFFTPMRNRILPGRHITDCQMSYTGFR